MWVRWVIPIVGGANPREVDAPINRYTTSRPCLCGQSFYRRVVVVCCGFAWISHACKRLAVAHFELCDLAFGFVCLVITAMQSRPVHFILKS